MKKIQRNKNKMYRVTASFLDTHAGIVAEIPGMPALVSEFKAQLASIAKSAVVQHTNREGITIEKSGLKAALVNSALEAAIKLRAYAVNSENSVLSGIVNYSYREFANMSGNRLLTHAGIISDQAGQHLPALAAYGYTEEKLLQLRSGITAFAAVKEAPRKGIVERKGATEQLAQLFKATDELLFKADILMGVLRSDNASVYGLYKGSRALTGAGFRKLSVRGRVKDENGNAIANVRVKAGSLKKKIVTTGKGNFNIRRFKSGEHIFVFSKSGYIDHEAEVAVVRGERTEVSVVLREVEV